MASTVLLFMACEAAPVDAAGPLYAVPSHPPSETEAVGFTNALNHRVRHLPTPLKPPTAQSPEEVEARVQALERGVVIERGTSQPRVVHPVHRQKTAKVVVVGEPGDRAPLSIAFVAAGVLAFLGLLLSARGSTPVRPSRPRGRAASRIRSG